ncbi:MAG: haloacid dehalogenase-like hydrolase [Prevotella sp.]|jgi:HAD superfamily phosphoserine phosphatase-like hydrolase|nr:haloacid dehalogenase-like hydrolase [Prevotella sp.]MCI2080091.1 haloacid dehalogenase-like hydrolase [Prevotella sp.]MCI2101893.1 haloacid dehalogenase-like hydrolase [Prevotella sp.]
MTEVYAFDFDGTLTTQDTLLQFIRYAKGTAAFIGGFLLFSPLLILMKLHLYPNGKVKEKIFSFFFKEMEIRDFQACCDRFAQVRKDLIRPQGWDVLQKAVNAHAIVIVVSASIDNWVRPFFNDFPEGSIRILGTQIEVINHRVTGRFLTSNCYGKEKVRRIQEILKEKREDYDIKAFGDSRGDQELLAYANTGFYKPFREK